MAIGWVVGTRIYGHILEIFVRKETVIPYACWCHTNAFAVTLMLKKRFINRCPRRQLMVCPMIVGHIQYIHVMGITGTYWNSVIGPIYPLVSLDISNVHYRCLQKRAEAATCHSSGQVSHPRGIYVFLTFLAPPYFFVFSHQTYDCRVSCLLGMWTKSHVFFSACAGRVYLYTATIKCTTIVIWWTYHREQSK